MNRYEVILAVPSMGKVKHVIRAADVKAACERAMAAHDQARVIATKDLARE
jgi:hypothetical protein